MNQIEELLKRVLTSLLVDMVISGARGGGEFLKIKIRPVVIRDILYFQVSKYTDKQVFDSRGSRAVGCRMDHE